MGLGKVAFQMIDGIAPIVSSVELIPVLHV